MYTVSENYETVINGYSRHFQARLLKNGEIVNAEIKKHSVRKYSSTGEDISIGCAFASSAEISCIAASSLSSLKDSEITLETGLEITSGEYEYVPDGVYTITSEKTKGEITTLIGYDRMYVKGNTTFSWPIIPVQYFDLITELATQLGVEFDSSCLEGVEDFTIEDFVDDGDFTLQKMAGYLAGLIGRNAYINRAGQLTFQAYADSGYIFDGNRISDIDVDRTAREINWLQCTVGDETLQSGIGAGYAKMENPLMTEKLLETVAEKIPISYYGAEAAFLLGDPRLDPWDLVHYKVKMVKDILVDEDGATLVDEFGNVFADWGDGLIPILCHEMTYSFDGGLSMDITSYALSETEENTNFRGPTQQAVEKAQQDAKDAKEAAEDAKAGVSDLDKKLTAKEIFDRLTENGTLQGLFKDEDTGDILINAAYIVAGILASLGGESWISLEDGSFSFLNDLIKGDADGLVADALVLRDGLYVQQKSTDGDGNVYYGNKKYPFLTVYLTNKSGAIWINPNATFDEVLIEGLVSFEDHVGIRELAVTEKSEFSGDAAFNGNTVFNSVSIPKAGCYVHTATGTSGSAGYVKIAQLVINGNYANQLLIFHIAQRGRKEYSLEILFANVDNTDPTLASFVSYGTQAGYAYLVKSATSTWDLYIQKAESYDSICVTEFYKGSYMTDRVTVTWTDEHLDNFIDLEVGEEIEASCGIKEYDSGWIDFDSFDDGIVSQASGQDWYKTCSYRKIGNRVYVRGHVAMSDAYDGSSAVNVFTLPAGYRPIDRKFALNAMTGRRIARIQVQSSGIVKVEWAVNITDGSYVTGSVTWIEVDIDFLVD